MAILGIESSCDETAAAVIDNKGKVLSHQVASQIKDHASWGGVVPQIAARAHADVLAPLVQKTLKEADLAARDLEAVAATAGPGLVGSVMLGLVFAKTMAANPAFSYLFPVRTKGNTRSSQKYIEPMTRSSRYYLSSVPFFIRLLNGKTK